MSTKNKKDDIKDSIKEKIKEEELNEEELTELIENVEDFDEAFLKALTGTQNFEIVPTIDEDGNTLTKKQYSMIKKECDRLGLKRVYRIDYSDKVVLFDPDSMKTGVVTEGVH